MAYTVGVPLFAHPGGIFPPVAIEAAGRNGSNVDDLQVPLVAIRVESVTDFSRAHDLGLEIAGYPMGPYRLARIGGERQPWLSSSAEAIEELSRIPASWPGRDE